MVIHILKLTAVFIRATPYYSSFSSVSVRLSPRFFLRRLTDTYDLGNLPKIGTGFVEVHASLREIPEGDEKYGRLSAPYFSIVRE